MLYTYYDNIKNTFSNQKVFMVETWNSLEANIRFIFCYTFIIYTSKIQIFKF